MRKFLQKVIGATKRVTSNFQTISNDLHKSKRTKEYDEYWLGDNQFFVLGDNTENSLDGRYWGTINRGQIIGKALFVFWPFSNNWGWKF